MGGWLEVRVTPSHELESEGLKGRIIVGYYSFKHIASKELSGELEGQIIEAIAWDLVLVQV